MGSILNMRKMHTAGFAELGYCGPDGYSCVSQLAAHGSAQCVLASRSTITNGPPWSPLT